MRKIQRIVVDIRGGEYNLHATRVLFLLGCLFLITPLKLVQGVRNNLYIVKLAHHKVGETNLIQSSDCIVRDKMLDSYFDNPTSLSLLRGSLFATDCPFDRDQLAAISEMTDGQILDPVTSWFLGKIYFDQGYKQEAMEYWQRGGVAQYHLAMAERMILQEKPQESVYHLQLAKNIDPDIVIAPLYGVVARYYMARQDWNSVYEICRLALEIEPSNPDSHYWCGIGLSGLGRTNDAIQELRAAIILGDNLWANYQLAKVYISISRMDEAICQLAISSSLNSDASKLDIHIESVDGRYAIHASALPNQDYLLGYWSTMAIAKRLLTKYTCIASQCTDDFINKNIRIPEQYWSNNIPFLCDQGDE